jgi:hypothetical protein
MTLKEAKKILKKEGFHMALAKEVVNQTGAMREFEKPEVCKAIKVANANKLIVGLSPEEWYEREARLKKEFEERSNAPVPGKEQPEEKKRIICWSASPKADFYYKYVLNEGNPALKESASQFNDALLDEQAKKIKKQDGEITRLLSLVEKKENSISRLHYEKSVLEKENEDLKKGEIPAKYFDKALVDEQAEKIKKLEHEKLDILEMASSCKQTIAEQADKIKRLGMEIARLNKNIYKKNMKIEELRKESSRHLRGKIKMFGENVDLEQMLKDKNAVLSDVAEELRLSKIREKNLTEVSQKYLKENEELREKVAEKTNLVEMIRNASKEYCDYGVAANEFIKELASLYVLANNTGIINDEILECCKNYQTYGFPANCNRETKKEINDIARGKTKVVGVDKAEEGGDHSAIFAQCCKNIAISKDEAEIIERCTKDGTELHYSEKDGFTYTNIFGDEIPIICLRGMCQVFTDEEIKNMKK